MTVVCFTIFWIDIDGIMVLFVNPILIDMAWLVDLSRAGFRNKNKNHPDIL